MPLLAFFFLLQVLIVGSLQLSKLGLPLVLINDTKS